MRQTTFGTEREGTEPGVRRFGRVSGFLRLRAARRFVIGDRRGAVAFEFILIAPFLFFLLFGILIFGIALNNQLELTAAAQQGAQTLSFGRGTATPYTTAISAVTSAAFNLTSGSIGRTVTVGGSTCATDTACTSLLTSGATASVALTYPCSMTVMGITFGPTPCNLYSTSAATVQ